MRQTCKVCGRPDKFDFTVPDRVWRDVVPLRFRKLVVCLFCFDGFARQRNIDYADYLRTLYFAGDKASFEFRVVKASNDERGKNYGKPQHVVAGSAKSIGHSENIYAASRRICFHAFCM